MQFNLSNEELPEGVISTDEIMAKKGAWVSGSEAAEMIETLIQHITDRNVRFGVFRDDSEEIIRELRESLRVAKQAEIKGGKFNFSVVM